MHQSLQHLYGCFCSPTCNPRLSDHSNSFQGPQWCQYDQCFREWAMAKGLRSLWLLLSLLYHQPPPSIGSERKAEVPFCFCWSKGCSCSKSSSKYSHICCKVECGKVKDNLSRHGAGWVIRTCSWTGYYWQSIPVCHYFPFRYNSTPRMYTCHEGI